jgi:hypothetical protein
MENSSNIGRSGIDLLATTGGLAFDASSSANAVHLANLNPNGDFSLGSSTNDLGATLGVNGTTKLLATTTLPSVTANSYLGTDASSNIVAVKPSLRWLDPYYTGIAVTNATTLATSTVFLEEINVPLSCTATGMSIVEGTPADSTDLVFLGLYGPANPTSFGDTASSSAIVAQATTTFSTTNTGKVVNFVSTAVIQPGIYYIAAKFSSSSISYLRQSNQIQIPGITQLYADGSTSSLPSSILGSGSLTNSASAFPGMKLLCPNL